MSQDSRQDADVAPVTFVNVIEVPADQVERFVATWRERARIMSTAPGFRDSRLHRALSSETRFQLINVAHWDSRGAWQAAMANPEFRARMRALEDDPDITVSANPALYEVVAGFGEQLDE
ncbi:antibiotic biosynthesis monooxygenase family protein [Streptomyces caatingaensis]|uniref:Monooxygenase n=1 Tax=Streptomyces caatingaensis TaxID=1678637 RepID=A0A0K9XL25_9ACTN|nr:antibiotic biosynthesis monooxygenase family protein [Streptomyces caatingaensis]KNB53796.1 monooxygenase [Streptomyces caatingaensis]